MEEDIRQLNITENMAEVIVIMIVKMIMIVDVDDIYSHW